MRNVSAINCTKEAPFDPSDNIPNEKYEKISPFMIVCAVEKKWPECLDNNNYIKR